MPLYYMETARATVRNMLLGARQTAAESKPKPIRSFVDLTAREVHKAWIGSLRPNRMRMACQAMRQLKIDVDEVLEQPPKGDGPRLRIRFYLDYWPR